MVSRKGHNFMQCEAASACAAAASFSRTNLSAAMDAAMLASILFALLVAGLGVLDVLCALVVLAAVSIHRIMICDRKTPESWA